MRRGALALLVLVALGAVLAACGGAGSGGRAQPAVRLLLSAPGDSSVIRAGSVEVSGRVAPARAKVEIMGVEAPTAADGRFQARVRLTEGPNMLDVSASASGRRPALAALRVTRDTRVTIPVLYGADPDAATARLERLGLSVTETRDGGFFDHLVPAPILVCGTEPGAGARVERGAGVRLHVARSCG